SARSRGCGREAHLLVACAEAVVRARRRGARALPRGRRPRRVCARTLRVLLVSSHGLRACRRECVRVSLPVERGDVGRTRSLRHGRLVVSERLRRQPGADDRSDCAYERVAARGGAHVTVAPDGSPVALYVLFPPAGEAERVHAAIPEGATVLDLGCGVGRISHELVRLGHPVVAVDESHEMLARVRKAETVQARIESLDLGRRFPCVLLASHLVNTAEPARRRAFLAACARHVADDGAVLIERHEPGWTPEEGVRGRMGDVTIALEDVRIEPPRVTATVRYDADGRPWRHPFDAHLLEDATLDEELRAVGLQLTGILDERGTWVEARLYSGA